MIKVSQNTEVSECGRALLFFTTFPPGRAPLSLGSTIERALRCLNSHRTWRACDSWRRLIECGGVPLYVSVSGYPVCIYTQCVPSVATRVVAKIYRPFYLYFIHCVIAALCVFKLEHLSTPRHRVGKLAERAGRR